MFFFFQAEDGIRDGHVTGVQTCALPIFARDLFAKLGPNDLDDAMRAPTRIEEIAREHRIEIMPAEAYAIGPKREIIARSEERRVGKECSSRGAGAHDREEVRGQDRCGAR